MMIFLNERAHLRRGEQQDAQRPPRRGPSLRAAAVQDRAVGAVG